MSEKPITLKDMGDESVLYGGLESAPPPKTAVPYVDMVTVSQCSDEDYVKRFMERLAEPDMRLVTESRSHDWANHGTAAKAAILAALKQAVAFRNFEKDAVTTYQELEKDRDSWKKGCENWFGSAKLMQEERDAAKLKFDSLAETYQQLRTEYAKALEGAHELASVHAFRGDCLLNVALSSIVINIVLAVVLAAKFLL